VKWCEITAKPSMQAGFSVGLNLDNVSSKRCILGDDKFSVSIDRMNEASLNCFAGLHWIVAQNFNLQARPTGQFRHLEARSRLNGLYDGRGDRGRGTVPKALRATARSTRRSDENYQNT
jgi:hypothetical protein